MPLQEGEVAVRWADILPAEANLGPDVKDDCLLLKFELNHRIFDMSNCGTIGFSNCYGYYQTVCFFYNPATGARLHNKDRLPGPYVNAWGVFSPEVQDRINQATDRLVYTEEFEDLVIEKLLSTVKKRGYQSIVFTDSINRGTVGRLGSAANSHSTAYTMKIIEKKKCGYLLKSPLSLNPAHFAVGDISIIRHFIWYPPGSLAFKCEKYLGIGTIAKTPQDLNDRLEDSYLYKMKAGSYTANTKDELTEALKSAVVNWNKPKGVDKK